MRAEGDGRFWVKTQERDLNEFQRNMFFIFSLVYKHKE